MTAFRNLSIGLKLSASAGLAIVMLTAMVLIVRVDVTYIAQAQKVLIDAAAVSEALNDIEEAGRDLPVLLRDLTTAQAPEAVSQSQDSIAQALDRARKAQPRLAAFGGNDERLAAEAAALGAPLEAFRTGLAGLVEQRRRLLAARDERFYPASGEYDQAFESVLAGLEFEVEGGAAAVEEARTRFLAFHGAVNDVRLGLQRFLATAEEAQIRRIRRALAQQRVHLSGAASVRMSERMRDDVNRLSALAQTMAGAAEEILAASEAVSAVRRDVLSPARAALGERLDAVRAMVGQAEQQAQASLHGTMREIVGQVTLLGAGIALVLALSGWASARVIAAPLRRLAGSVTAIAGGDVRLPVPDRDRRDEIGLIAGALERLRGEVGSAFARQQMIAQLPLGVMTADPKDEYRINYTNAAMGEILERLRSALPCAPEEVLGRSIDIFHKRPEHQRALLADPANLPHRVRIALAGEVMDLQASAITDASGAYVGPMLTWRRVTEQARLADTFEQEVGGVVEGVAARAAELRVSAESVAAAARASGGEAAEVAEASGRASADVGSVAAAAEEMASSVAEISRRVAEAAAVAGRAVEEARATDATVRGLSESAGRIGDVVRLIGDIAGQTNLLALNATIEAARAGDAGKGFAVVAGEVKALAAQTAKATEEIAAQIQQMQSATGSAVEAIRGIGATVERTSEIATAIAAAVEEQGSATREIARSAGQVAEGTSTVAAAIEGVRRAADQTGASAGGMLDASAGLSAQADALRSRSAEFLRAVRAA